MPDPQLRFSFDSAPSDAPAAITFIRHRRARRYILRVLDDGTLRVTLPRWGSKREARGFVDANQDWIARQRARRRKPAPAGPRDSSLAQHVERWWRAKAERELPGMLMALNWRLIRVPDFVKEYVMLHELMHRRELNHSRRFWRLVASCCPRYAEARAWLKTNGGIEN